MIKTISSKFVNNILQDFRDFALRNDKSKANAIMADLILLRAALDEKEKEAVEE